MTSIKPLYFRFFLDSELARLLYDFQSTCRLFVLNNECTGYEGTGKKQNCKKDNKPIRTQINEKVLYF